MAREWLLPVPGPGRGYGRFLLAPPVWRRLTLWLWPGARRFTPVHPPPACCACRQAMPGHNMLGLEIREPIIERANRWAQHLSLQRSVLFLR